METSSYWPQSLFPPIFTIISINSNIIFSDRNLTGIVMSFITQPQLSEGYFTLIKLIYHLYILISLQAIGPAPGIPSVASVGDWIWVGEGLGAHANSLAFHSLWWQYFLNKKNLSDQGFLRESSNLWVWLHEYSLTTMQVLDKHLLKWTNATLF